MYYAFATPKHARAYDERREEPERRCESAMSRARSTRVFNARVATEEEQDLEVPAIFHFRHEEGLPANPVESRIERLNFLPSLHIARDRSDLDPM